MYHTSDRNRIEIKQIKKIHVNRHRRYIYTDKVHIQVHKDREDIVFKDEMKQIQKQKKYKGWWFVLTAEALSLKLSAAG